MKLLFKKTTCVGVSELLPIHDVWKGFYLVLVVLPIGRNVFDVQKLSRRQHFVSLKIL